MSSSVRIPDFQVAGDSDTTVFLLHGAYGSKDYFRPEIETLVRAGLRVVAWDAPGYGLSALPKSGLRIEDMAEAAVKLIGLMGTRTNVLLGHSMGGIIAPAAAGLGDVVGVFPSARWWAALGDPALDSLVDTALAGQPARSLLKKQTARANTAAIRMAAHHGMP